MYQVERAVYGLMFEAESWSAWVQRREAPAVPGVKPFLDRVRAAGGRVAFVADRDASLMDPTRANLAALGVWSDDNRLCGQEPVTRKPAAAPRGVGEGIRRLRVAERADARPRVRRR